MSDFNRGYARTVTADRADMSVDAGLRSFMLGVYNKLALGLLLSAGLAYLTGANEATRGLFYHVTADGHFAGMTLLGMVIQFSPIVMLLGSMFFMKNPSPAASGILYWLVVSAMGAGLGIWVLLYTSASIFLSFLITASAFGSLSLYGYITKRNLTGLGSFLLMGLIGLMVASVANIWLNSGALGWIVNVVGVLVFAGLIAFNTQRLKMTYYELGGDQASLAVATNYGALSLYIDFINLFLFILRIFGSRR